MKKRKWYLSLPIIALCFAFSSLIVPLALGVILMITRMKEDRKLRDLLQEILSRSDEQNQLIAEIVRLKKETEKFKEEKRRINKEIEDKQKSLGETKKELKALMWKKKGIDEEISILTNDTNSLKAYKKLENELYMYDVHAYEKQFDFEHYEEYKAKHKELKDELKQLIKDGKAIRKITSWSFVDFNIREGEIKKLRTNFEKLLLRIFNAECDFAISKMTINTYEATKKKIDNSFHQLNKLAEPFDTKVYHNYWRQKLNEAKLWHEMLIQKQEEKEEQQRIREQMREEVKIQKEIEKEKAKIEKEEKHFNAELGRLQAEMEKASNEKQDALVDKIKELEEKLKLLDKDKKNVFDREQNTRAGYVYIISNIGSFGEDVYKIGMTRRLEPTDRVNELGGASVPFRFDVHAMIFSDDAPNLENALHQHFKDRSVNKVNLRKEFFNVSLEEIQNVVEKNHNKIVEFTKLAEAHEYRQSLAMQNELIEEDSKELVTA